MFDDTFLIGLALFACALLVSGPIALAVMLGPRGRIAVLEARLARLERGQPAPSPAPRAEGFARPEPKQAAEPAPALDSAPESPPRPDPKPATVPPIRPKPPEPSEPAAKRPSFEERFGTRWTVWIGGLALAVGAALLVRYSVESGFFGPGMRVLSGLVLGLGLLAGGEALRRRLRGAGPVPPRMPDIPAMVTAAGSAALFGAIYAAYALYGFVGPELALIGLGATGLLTMLAALLHGPALAGIGLVGAMGTPLLIGGSSSNLWPLVLYLTIVAATAYGFAWTRGWRMLAVAAGIGGGAWALFLAAFAPPPAPAALVHAALQAALAALAFAVLPHRGGANEAARPDAFASGALAAFGLVLVAVLGMLSGAQADATWIATALAAAAIPALAAFLAPAAAAGLCVAGLCACAVVVLWPEQLGPDWTMPLWARTPEPGQLLTVAGLSALAATAVGALRLLGGARLPAPTALLYAAGAALTPLGLLALTYLRIAEGAVSPPFAASAGVLALAMTGLAAVFRAQSERTPSEGLTLGLGAFASAAIASLALGLIFAVSGGSLTVAMALAALGTAGIARRLDIKALRWCVAGLGLVVAARLAWDPTVVGPDLGTTPVLNWLLVGYGLPALAFGAASVLIRLPDSRPDAPVLIAQALSLLLAAFLVFFEIRHALHGGDIFAEETSLAEQGLLALSGLGFALATVRLDRVHGSAVIRIASLAFGALAIAQSLIGLGFVANPVVTDDAVAGGLIFNEIALAYGLPMLAAFALAQAARASRPAWYVRSAAGLGVILGFLGVSLLIRHGFRGERLGLLRGESQTEWYAYSAGWLALGLAFLAYGVLRGSLTARLASAALVVLSIAKVFLFDLAGLDGPLRALSFLGLGAVLIGIGLVYQRFVFAPGRSPAGPDV